MNTNDLTPKIASQTTNLSSQSLMGTGVPTFPLPGAGVPSFNYAIAMQQHQFQQSLANQQLLAQQQAVAHAVSIKAAAEQATARAAEISKLLKGEIDDVPKEKAEESAPRRESSESKSRSPSPRSSKSKSPIRYSNSRKERREYSPRDGYSYRGPRHFSYHSRYRRDLYQSNYRRNTYHSGGRSDSHYRRSRSRNRGESPSISRSMRYRRDDSRSPKNRRVRSPSPNSRESRRRISSRVSNRRSMSRSPINDSSISPRPRRSRILSPRKPTVRRSLSSSENSPSRSSTSLLEKDNRDDHDVSSSENNNAFKQEGKEPRPMSKHLASEGFNSSSRSRSRSTSTDYSGKRNTQEPSFRRAVPDKFVSATMGRSSSASSDLGSLRRTSGANDDESGSASSLQRPTGDTYETGIVNSERQYLPNSVMGRRIDQDGMKPPSINKLSLSPENSISDHGGQKMYDERKENIGADGYVMRERHLSKESTHKSLKLNEREHELSPKVYSSSEDGSAYSEDKETDDRSNGKYHCRTTCSEDITTMKEDVSKRNHTMKRGASNHEVDRSGHPRTLAEYAIYPLPDSHGSMDGKLMQHRSPEEANQLHRYDVKFSPTLSNGAAKADNEQVPTSPNVCQYPERRSKQMSRSRSGSRSRERRRKHSKRHHKRRQREESEEDDDHKKEKRRELKLKRHEKKSQKKRHKSRKERKRKRKHRDSSSCSSDDSSSSSGDEYKKVCYDVSSKRSTGSKKKRRPSPAASTSSSE